MINLFKVRMSPEAAPAVAKVLESGFVGQGKVNEAFEQALWKEMGSRYKPVTVNSCTSALDLALEVCGVGPGDEVISTPFSCYATNAPINNRKATIVWADVYPLTGNIDPESFDITPKTKAIMSVDWAGRICDFEQLNAFGVPTIEDAAHRWDSGLDHKQFYRGDYVCYSFQAIKFNTSGDGGAIIAPSEEKRKELELLRWYGLDRTLGQSFRCTQNIQKSGFKYHMNDVMSAIGLANLPGTQEAVNRHRSNAEIYDEAFEDLTSITIPPPDPGCSYWLYSLLVEKGTKEEFMAHLAAHGVESSPVHFRNDLYDCTKQFKTRELPGVDAFAKKQVSIPIGWWLTEKDLEIIIEAVRSY